MSDYLSRADLLALGLIRSSFVPPAPIQELRDLTRTRKQLVRESNRHTQRIQKTLEDANIKLTEVVDDITGSTGMKIIKDIVRGVRDQVQLAKNRNVRCHASEAEIARSLCGNWRIEHLFALQQALQLHEFYHRQLRVCDEKIEACLRQFADKSGGEVLTAKKCSRRGNAVSFDAPQYVVSLSGHPTARVAASAGIGYFGTRGSWADGSQTNVDFGMRVAFAGAQIAAPGGAYMLTVRRSVLRGTPYFAAFGSLGSPDFDATTVFLERQLRL